MPQKNTKKIAQAHISVQDLPSYFKALKSEGLSAYQIKFKILGRINLVHINLKNERGFGGLQLFSSLLRYMLIHKPLKYISS